MQAMSRPSGTDEQGNEGLHSGNGNTADEDSHPVEWIFGYGSLIWRPAFPFVESRVAIVQGFVRRFWQGSTDHRGTPERPGRVVTLVPCARAHCWGRAFRFHADQRAAILAQLDHREQGGYSRHVVDLRWAGEPEPTDAQPSGLATNRGPSARRSSVHTEQGVRALLYVATSDNVNYLGPASPGQIAREALEAQGPSGANRDYVLELDAALREMGGVDPHVTAVAERLRQLAVPLEMQQVSVSTD
jgi:cation transport regulator ChaC